MLDKIHYLTKFWRTLVDTLGTDHSGSLSESFEINTLNSSIKRKVRPFVRLSNLILLHSSDIWQEDIPGGICEHLLEFFLQNSILILVQFNFHAILLVIVCLVSRRQDNKNVP